MDLSGGLGADVTRSSRYRVSRSRRNENRRMERDHRVPATVVQELGGVGERHRHGTPTVNAMHLNQEAPRDQGMTL